MFSSMKDMRRTDAEKIAADSPFTNSAVTGPTGPDYPYGLRIRLNQDDLDKLDLDGGCQVGDMIDLRAFAKVINVSSEEVGGKMSCSIELQIQQLAVESEEEEAAPAPKRASRYK